MKVAIIGASGSIGKAFVEHFLKSWETKKLYLFSRSDINFDDVRVINHFIDNFSKKMLTVNEKYNHKQVKIFNIN